MKTYRLTLNPETHVRSTKGDAVLFRIPEECPHRCGLPRRSTKQPLIEVKEMRQQYPELWQILGGEAWRPQKGVKTIRYGCPHCLSDNGLKRKRRLERYNNYKENFLTEAKRIKFSINYFGTHFYYYFPMPVRWSKKKKAENHLRIKMNTPDIDNLEKASFDAMLKNDSSIAGIFGAKLWADSKSGWIEAFVPESLEDWTTLAKRNWAIQQMVPTEVLEEEVINLEKELASFKHNFFHP